MTPEQGQALLDLVGLGFGLVILLLATLIIPILARKNPR